MRPRDPGIRTKYRECVARLTAANVPVSIETISRDLTVPFDTVRTFMYRNPVFAKSVGITQREHYTPLDYLAAAVALDAAGVRITTYELATALKRDHSVVARFLRNHPGTHACIYEETGQLVGRAEVPALVKAKKLPNYLTKHLDKRAS